MNNVKVRNLFFIVKGFEWWEHREVKLYEEIR